MLKRLMCFFALFCLILIPVGCSNTEEVEDTIPIDEDLIGEWRYTGPDNNGTEYELDLSFDEDSGFVLTAINPAAPPEQANQDGSEQISGSYEISGTDIIFTVQDIQNSTGLFVSEPPSEDAVIPYSINAEDATLTLNNLNTLIPGMPGDLTFKLVGSDS